MNSEFLSQLRLTESSTRGFDPPRVKMSGSLCFENAQELLDSVRGVLARRPKEVVLELEEVAVIDSSGLRGLLECSKLCRQAGAALQLGSLSDTAARIIRLGGLEEAFGLPRLTWTAPKPAPFTKAEIDKSDWVMYEYVATSEASAACPRCGAVIRSLPQEGRPTTWCPGCQA